ncbi:hypothetical protein SH449x_000949 [Pirellulaceae bacterium SH449]
MSDRDNKGKFLPGNQAKKGKVKKSYSQILREVLDESAAKKIFKKAVEDAKAGDHQARTWLFSFVLPKLHSVEHREVVTESVSQVHGSDYASPEYRALLDACKTEEELEFVIKITDRTHRSGNPFSDFFERPLDDETKTLLDAMTPEERDQFFQLLDKAAERHRRKPVRQMTFTPQST